MKDIYNDAFDVNQHLLANVYDVLAQILYQNSLSAAAALGKDYKKYSKKAPKPMKRPQVRKTPEETKKFATTKELLSMFSKKAGGTASRRRR